MRCVNDRVVLLAFMLVSAMPVQAPGQSPMTTAASLGCTYATCALRIERSLFAERLVRGAAAERVSTLGMFGGGVEVLISSADSASVHAQSYVWNVKRSAVIGGAGGIALGIAFSHTNNFQSGHVTTGDVVASIAGAVAAAVSVPFALRARRELASSIFWYNGALPR